MPRPAAPGQRCVRASEEERAWDRGEGLRTRISEFLDFLPATPLFSFTRAPRACMGARVIRCIERSIAIRRKFVACDEHTPSFLSSDS